MKKCILHVQASYTKQNKNWHEVCSFHCIFFQLAYHFQCNFFQAHFLLSYFGLKFVFFSAGRFVTCMSSVLTNFFFFCLPFAPVLVHKTHKCQKTFQLPSTVIIENSLGSDFNKLNFSSRKIVEHTFKRILLCFSIFFPFCLILSLPVSFFFQFMFGLCETWLFCSVFHYPQNKISIFLLKFSIVH